MAYVTGFKGSVKGDGVEVLDRATALDFAGAVTVSATGPNGATALITIPTVAGPTGPTGAASTVAGPAGPTGPTGAASTVAGPTGPTGANSTVAGPTGPTGPAMTSYTTSFTSANVSAGILTVTHNLGRQFVFPIIFDNSNKMLYPDDYTATSTSVLTVDLTTYGTITGTWNVLVH